jgi:hypothetical protein
VVLANPDKVNAHLVGEHCFGDNISDNLGVRHKAPLGGAGHIAKGIEAEFKLLVHRCCFRIAGCGFQGPRQATKRL